MAEIKGKLVRPLKRTLTLIPGTPGTMSTPSPATEARAPREAGPDTLNGKLFLGGRALIILPNNGVVASKSTTPHEYCPMRACPGEEAKRSKKDAVR